MTHTKSEVTCHAVLFNTDPQSMNISFFSAFHNSIYIFICKFTLIYKHIPRICLQQCFGAKTKDAQGFLLACTLGSLLAEVRGLKCQESNQGWPHGKLLYLTPIMDPYTIQVISSVFIKHCASVHIFQFILCRGMLSLVPQFLQKTEPIQRDPAFPLSVPPASPQNQFPLSSQTTKGKDNHYRNT